MSALVSELFGDFFSPQAAFPTSFCTAHFDIQEITLIFTILKRGTKQEEYKSY